MWDLFGDLIELAFEFFQAFPRLIISLFTSSLAAGLALWTIHSRSTRFTVALTVILSGFCLGAAWEYWGSRNSLRD